MLAAAGAIVDTTDVQTELRTLLKKVGVATVGHTCHPSGRPPFGKLAPVGTCARCDERREEKAAGIPARPAPAYLNRSASRREDTGGYPSTSAIDDHFRPGGPHKRGECGRVCTFGDW